MNTNKPAVDAELEALQHDTFSYFLHETNPHNGLVRDKTAPDWPVSIAATGLGLAGCPVVVGRGFITRTFAIERVLATLRFFWASPQGPEPDATGYRGFYYHFLDMQTGRRAWNCELSTVDSSRPYLAEIGLVGRAPGLYNLYLGGAFDGTRLNKLYAQDVDNAKILKLLDPLIVQYANERNEGERFGDFVIRAAFVTATPAGNRFHAEVELAR